MIDRQVRRNRLDPFAKFDAAFYTELRRTHLWRGKPPVKECTHSTTPIGCSTMISCRKNFSRHAGAKTTLPGQLTIPMVRPDAIAAAARHPSARRTDTAISRNRSLGDRSWDS